ncbi:MAG: hypothetical protein UW75_C0058G0005 [Parcubacteria group bacterium GW2011_GWF2_44_8]|nr:MAG: hypothetical protein UW75_C0058G0005 [Parcubacteria group bacterium GW2011_GWF2_44_8]
MKKFLIAAGLCMLVAIIAIFASYFYIQQLLVSPS